MKAAYTTFIGADSIQFNRRIFELNNGDTG